MLRLCPNAGGSSSVSGQETRFHMLHRAVKKNQKGGRFKRQGTYVYLWLIHVNSLWYIIMQQPIMQNTGLLFGGRSIINESFGPQVIPRMESYGPIISQAVV